MIKVKGNIVITMMMMIIIIILILVMIIYQQEEHRAYIFIIYLSTTIHETHIFLHMFSFFRSVWVIFAVLFHFGPWSTCSFLFFWLSSFAMLLSGIWNGRKNQVHISTHAHMFIIQIIIVLSAYKHQNY